MPPTQKGLEWYPKTCRLDGLPCNRIYTALMRFFIQCRHSLEWIVPFHCFNQCVSQKPLGWELLFPNCILLKRNRVTRYQAKMASITRATFWHVHSVTSSKLKYIWSISLQLTRCDSCKYFGRCQTVHEHSSSWSERGYSCHVSEGKLVLLSTC